MRGEVRKLTCWGVLGVYLLTVGFGAAPPKKERKIRFGPKFEILETRTVIFGNAKEKAWVETDDMRITGNAIVAIAQENPPGPEVVFDRIEAKGNVTLRASASNVTDKSPRKVHATSAEATFTQKREQIKTLEGEVVAIQQKVVLRHNVSVTTELAPGGAFKGLRIEGNQVTIATKTDGSFLVLADDATGEAIFEEP
ncbi:MAG: hypothetical protein NZT92_11560 [Abditibacteriales bacterium]|nr:hypothetical protein [Abditibacteriales bacterium]MDW8367003.1 hypothetical protein [Abditibacteriales bacterium]